MVKYILIFLFPLSVSAQELTQERIDELQYRSEIHQAGIYMVAGGMFLNMGFRALDKESVTANITCAAFSGIGLVIALTNWKQNKKYNEFKNRSKVYGGR